MTKKTVEMVECDRCGELSPPDHPNIGDFPRNGARCVFADRQVKWTLDLCSLCANDVGQLLRNGLKLGALFPPKDKP